MGILFLGTANTATLCSKTDGAAWEILSVLCTAQTVTKCPHTEETSDFAMIVMFHVYL